MATKDSTLSAADKANTGPLPAWGQNPTGAALALQKEILAGYEEASRTWLARLQSEVTLWSELATKLGATRTVPEALQAYSNCVSQRMKMAADDGRRLAEEAQHIVQKITHSLGNAGRPAVGQ